MHQNKIPPEVAKIKDTLQQAIEDKRQSMFMSQSKFAQKVGISQPRYNTLARGKLETFSTETLLGIALKAGVGVKLILEFVPRPEDEK